jgi:RNA polymerase sigma-70 factor, ECF subfamily
MTWIANQYTYFHWNTQYTLILPSQLPNYPLVFMTGLDLPLHHVAKTIPADQDHYFGDHSRSMDSVVLSLGQSSRLGSYLKAIMIFESIYREFDVKLRRFILGRVSDSDTAEDILQEVYLKIHAHIEDLRDTEKLESWIYQITRNAIIDNYRRAHPTEELSESLLTLPQEEPDAIAELAPSVQEMFNCLPEKYRQALELTEIKGLTQLEMAKQLGLSFSGAKSRVQRAREKLKEAFLDCCHFEFDRLDKVVGYEPKCSHCSQSRSNDCQDGCAY